MPVADVAVHPMTVQGELYDACREAIRKDGYWAPDRIYGENGYWVATQRYVEDRMSKDCRNDQSLVDPRCRTCPRVGEGLAYFLSVMEVAK